MSKTIGIDLGTGNSCVAVYENGESTVIQNAEGKRTTPSVVAWSADGDRKIGDAAVRQAVTNPKNTIYEVKRIIGCEYDKCKKDIDSFTFDVEKDGKYPKIVANNSKYAPQEISAMVLGKMKQTAEDYLGETVTDAVITVPAYFNDDQRKATIEAGKIAGLEVKRIINEPTAAALAYGVDKSDKDMKVLVYDCGAGTHDVSILEFGGGVFEVLASDGDTHLGGKDIDNKIIEWIVSEFKSAEGIDISNDAMAMQRVREAAEKAKIELSSTTQTEINLPYLTANETGPKHFVKNLTRSTFERMIDDFIKKTLVPCESALKAADLSKSDIDEILLVGGTTRIPALQKAVENFFGKAPSKGVNPDEAVAIGAAIQGAILSGDDKVGDIVLLDVTPLNLGIETLGNVMTTIIEANTTIPCKRSKTFSTAVDNQPGVEIHVLQGNRTMVSDNKSLGLFKLDGIPAAPRGIPQIEVTFDINANGVISVSAKDLGTNKEQHITIEGGSGLSDEEIERMKAEAEKYKAEDEKKRADLEAVNQAEGYAYDVEKTLSDESLDVFTEDDKKNLTDKIVELRKAISEQNYNDVKTKKKELEDLYTPIAKKIYKKKQEEASTKENKAEAETTSNPFENMGADNPFTQGFADANK